MNPLYRRRLTCLLLYILAFAAWPARAFTSDIGSGFFSAIDQHGAIMLLLDPETADILDANEAACAYYGYTRTELLSTNMDDINTLTLEEILVEMRASMNMERNVFSFRHALKSGEIRDVEVLGYPVLYRGRTVLLSVVSDVTAKTMLERKAHYMTYAGFTLGGVALLGLGLMLTLTLRSKKRLGMLNREIQDANLMLKTFIDAQGDLAYMMDEELRYVFVNRAVEEFYGKPAEEIIGKDDYALSDRMFAELRRQTDLEAIASGTLTRKEVACGGRIYLSTKFPVRMANGSMGVGAYIRDITEQRKDERNREMATRRLMILSSVMAHGFKGFTERLEYVLNEALNLTGSQYGIVYLYDEGSHVFTLNAFSQSVAEDSRIRNIPTAFHLADHGLWSDTVRRLNPVIVNDFRPPHGTNQPDGHVQIKRFMAVPVIVDGKIVAAVGLANRQEKYEEIDAYELTLLMTGFWNEQKRHEAQARLTFERSRYFQTLVSIGDGVMVVDGEGRIEILNTVAERLTGWSASEAVGRAYTEVFSVRHENPGETLCDPIAAALQLGEVQALGNHAVLQSKSGAQYNIEDSAAPIRDEGGRIAGAVLVFRDVTQKKQQLARMQYLSFHDSLTGLYNRRFMSEEIERLDASEELPITVVMGDVNGLKLTNDIFGHACGDILLQRISEILKACSRPGDILARWGGDEFVMVLPKTDAAAAEELIATIKRAFAKEKVRAIKGSISMGYAIKERPESNLSMVLSMAEDVMYSVKTFESIETNRSTVSEIIATLHNLSPLELEHSADVRDLAQRFGRAMRLPEEEVRKLRDAAYLHDIGKIVLDAELLNKTGALSDADWNLIRKHPIAGYRILNSFDDTMNLAETALAHHERWDGTGYPRGLKGSEIPLLARIVAILEAYDRMTRANLGNMPVADAIAELRRNAGTQFDPEIVERFVEMVEAES